MEQKKFAYFLPNIFTALNMSCGFVAILQAMGGDFANACRLIFLGGIFDLVDGRLARLTGTSSVFGEEFDSLSDVISFGIAPSLIFYLKFLSGKGRVGVAFSIFFMLCGAMRLARFNANMVSNPKDHFQGLPIPTGAMAIIGLVLLSIEHPIVANYPILHFVYIFLFGLLMISDIPFPSFKHSTWQKDHVFLFLILSLTIFAAIITYEEVMIFVLTIFYVFSSLLYLLFRKKKEEG